MKLDAADLIALSPLLVLAASAVAVMLAAAFLPRSALLLTLFGLLLSAAALPFAAGAGARQATPLILIDRYALYYMGLAFGASFVVAVQCRSYFRGSEGNGGSPGALHILLLLTALGGAVLAASSHFAAFLLGLEIYSVALFALIAYPADFEHTIEAAIKYLVLTGLSSALLLFGMALIYAQTGTMQFSEIGSMLTEAGYGADVILLAGLALILAGAGFKLALVPFHMWIADVYEGAPAPVAALVATISKGAVLALLLRYFIATGAYRSPSITLALSLLAIASILAGNLLALLQNKVKRILAYSSIAHLGYLLVAFLAAGTLASEAVGYYLAAYFITMLGAFGVVALLSVDGHEQDDLADYQGLFWRRPWLGGAFTAMLLSLAGMPLTMGFVGKFYIAAAGVAASLWLLVATLVVGSAIGLFYYLRIIAMMAAPTPATAAGQAAAPAATAAPAASAVLAVLTVLLIALGVYPAPLMQVLETTVRQLPALPPQVAR